MTVKNLKMWLKLAICVSVLLVLLGMMGLQGYQSLNSVEEEAQSLATVYVPIQTRAVGGLASIVSVPGSMNAYLYKGRQDLWAMTEQSLEGSRIAFDVLLDMFKKNPHLADGAREQAVLKSYSDLEKTVRALHDVDMEFKITQFEILKLGDAINSYSSQYLNFQLNHVTNGVKENAENTASRVEVLRRIYNLQNLVESMRESLMRALAEEAPQLCEQNISAVIPLGIRQAKQIEKFVITTEGKEYGARMQKDFSQFGVLQSKLLEQWAQRDALYGQMEKERDQAVMIANSIVEDSRKWQAASLASMQDTVMRNTRKMGFVGLTAGLVGLLVGWVLTRNVASPLSAAVSFARAVAAGNLSQRLRMDRKDEIGQLSVALDSMVDSLEAKIEESEAQSQQAHAKEEEAQAATRIAEAAGRESAAKSRALLEAADRLDDVASTVSSAASQLSTQLQSSASGAGQQAAHMGETAIAMDEMNATVLEVARNAAAAADASLATRKKAEDGSVIVRKAVDGIRKVRDESLVLKSDMLTLSEHAQAINQIMGVISDIADQTNLLALNAAIEAARAGDAGRGFAVVADEVRNLAEKTMASTTDVGNAIKAIQASAARSMTQVDATVSIIESATTYANQSGEALTEIVGMADHTANEVRAIATASEHQSSASDEIARAITQVSEIAGQTSTTMREANNAVLNLTSQSHLLVELIEKMKR